MTTLLTIRGSVSKLVEALRRPRAFQRAIAAALSVFLASPPANGLTASPAAVESQPTTFSFEFVPERHDKTFKDYLNFSKENAKGADTLKAQYLAAQLYMFKEDYKQAAEILQSVAAVVLNDEFFNISILQKLADCYMRLGLFDQAAQAYASVSKSDIKALIPEAILGLSVTSLAAGDREQAYLRFQELVSFYPAYKNMPNAMLPLGLVQWENAKYQDALEYFQRDPKNPACNYFAGVCLRSLGKPVEAMAVFKKLILEHDNTVWAERAKFELGETFYQQKDYPLAGKSFWQISKDHPKDFWNTLALYRLACADLQTKQYKDAEKKLWPLQKKLEKHQLKPNATYLLTESLAQQNKMRDLVRILQEEIKKDQKSPDNMYRLIWSLAAIGDYQQAIDMSEEFLKTNWDRELTPKTLLVEGYSFGSMGRDADAAATYQLVVDKFPESIYAAQAVHLMASTYFKSSQFSSIVTQVNHEWNSLPLDTRKKHPDAQFWIAEAHLKMQNGKEARENYQRFIDLAPPDHALAQQALLGQGVSYAVDKDYPTAVATLQRSYQGAQEKNDKEFMAVLMFEIGNVYFNSKDYENAAGAYRNFQTIDSNHPKEAQAMYQEGLSLYRAEYYADAVTAWQKMAKENPKDEKAPDALFRAGKTLFDLGKYPEAVVVYEKLAKTYPKTDLAKDARLQIGQSYFNAGDFNKAITAYSDFLKRYPADEQAPNVLQLLQTCYFRANKSPEEIEKLTKNQPKSPVLADIYWEQGAKLYNEKNYDKAREYFQKILYEFPGASVSAQAAFYRAESFYLQEKYADAVPTLESFIQAYPADAQISQAKFHLAVSYFNQNQFNEAGKAFDDFAKSFPDDPLAKNAVLNVALCYSKALNTEDAVEAYQNYIRLYPDAEDAGAAHLQMASMMEKAGDFERAGASYEAIPSNRGEYPEALFSAGRCYKAAGLTDKEAAVYQRLGQIPAKNDPFRIAGLLQLAEIYLTQSALDKALVVYQDVAQNAADAQSANLAKDRISTIQGGAQ